ncbi:hypothetical protein [Mesorhizobium sp.]|uniref:hypothetical protein n=1 Tax=Mesorhizobium sp. TaxID=1871066 RepID=UPI003BAB7EA4
MLSLPTFMARATPRFEATMCLVVPIDTSEERTGNLIGLLCDRAARLSIAA